VSAKTTRVTASQALVGLDVEIEVRGAGNATRRINHIVKPEFPAERLLEVEAFTPAGNWSSYPPHKHDQDRPPGEAVLEETYYNRTATSRPSPFSGYTTPGTVSR
jgi:5-deoxy-glucuronate isomerase